MLYHTILHYTTLHYTTLHYYTLGLQRGDGHVRGSCATWCLLGFRASGSNAVGSSFAFGLSVSGV